MERPLCALLTLTLTLALAGAGASQAQELTGYAGALRVNETGESTFSAGVAYAHAVDDHLALNLSYWNEGHPADHHRDGVAGQIWLRTGLNEPGWHFGAGAGRYFYFDTTELHTSGASRYTNDHGWAAIYSLQATYHMPDSRWYGQLQLNRISPGDKNSTTTLLLGAGYQFSGVKGDKLHLEAKGADQALTLMAGQGITNSLRSETALIGALEYRRSLGRYVDWSVSAIHEGSAPQNRRNGVATQLWLIRSVSRSTEIGAGAGPYFNFRVPDGEGQRSHKAGLLSLGARYHLNRQLVAQAWWNRVVTDYHRDADLFLAGLGYSF